MQDLMFAEEPVENREQLLRDNCDQLEDPHTQKLAKRGITEIVSSDNNAE